MLLIFLNVAQIKEWQGDLLHVLDLIITLLWLAFDLLYIRKSFMGQYNYIMHSWKRVLIFVSLKNEQRWIAILTFCFYFKLIGNWKRMFPPLPNKYFASLRECILYTIYAIYWQWWERSPTDQIANIAKLNLDNFFFLFAVPYITVQNTCYQWGSVWFDFCFTALQHILVISGAVSYPNHTISGQAS